MSVGSTHSAKPPFRHHGRHEACAQIISSASSLHGDATGGLWPRAETGAHEVTDPQPYSPCTTDSWMQPAACFCHSCRGGGGRQHGRLQWTEAGEGLEEEGGRESSATPFVPEPPCSVRTGTPPPHLPYLSSPPHPPQPLPPTSLVLLPRPFHAAYATTPITFTTATDFAAFATPGIGVLAPMRRHERWSTGMGRGWSAERAKGGESGWVEGRMARRWVQRGRSSGVANRYRLAAAFACPPPLRFPQHPRFPHH